MAHLELPNLRSVIETKGAHWTTGDTEISGYLDQPEEVGLFGLSLSEDDRE